MLFPPKAMINGDATSGQLLDELDIYSGEIRIWEAPAAGDGTG